ncbi:VOC family protein [Sphingomonas kyeonggiensis]|uniref:Putative enzyme related to lactoylglutathione lyase n=1 Tax=Sphingomonas kyeonggiensis TaxID=1268553 RepID=A0A7W6JSX5_9SPHN|nr:VOC family protein [Sphingomonas kyeonggiensis]MBB4098890.1 putative enzyme related to lactoylglutathione lyase [Sphingomonas kyeonggiensis]
MPNFNFLLLHVEDAAASATFYSSLLDTPILDQRPGFTMLPLRDGVTLGLWGKETVEPASGQSGASEIAFAVADKAAVEATHADWAGRGLRILQPPTAMNFGTTFVASDPDGHRLRVFAPPAA